MPEDKLIVVAEHRPQPPLPELKRQAVGHGDQPARAEIRLALTGVLTPHPGVPNANALRHRVDIAPAHAQQLGLPDARRASGKDHQAQDRTERVTVHHHVRDHGDHRIELPGRQELQIGAGVGRPPPPGTRGIGHRVGLRPPLSHGQCEHGVQERHRVPHRLRGQALREQRPREPLYVLRLDRVDPSPP
jgi:hypothetical protein